MAKIVIEFDTSTKEMSCAVNGAPVPDVVSVNIYPRDYVDMDEYSISIQTRSEDEERELTLYNSMTASQGFGVSSLDGFGERRRPRANAVASQIHEFLK